MQKNYPPKKIDLFFNHFRSLIDTTRYRFLVILINRQTPAIIVEVRTSEVHANMRDPQRLWCLENNDSFVFLEF